MEEQLFLNKNTILNISEIKNPIWVSISEAAKFGGVNQKTIRRAIQSKQIKYKITKERYSLELQSALQYFHTNTKLYNKYMDFGLGQYVEALKK